MKKKTCQKCETKFKQIFCISKRTKKSQIKQYLACEKLMDKLLLALKETTDLLVESFASIFTREKALDENCVLENMAEQIKEFTVEEEEVVQQLNSLNIHKAAGPNTSYDNKNSN